MPYAAKSVGSFGPTAGIRRIAPRARTGGEEAPDISNARRPAGAR